MKTSRRDTQKLDDLLRQAYREKEKLAVGEQWQRETMRTIRRLAARDPEAGFLKMFERLVWRLAPVACAMIIVLGVVFMSFDLVPDTELLQLLSYEPEENNLMQMFVL